MPLASQYGAALAAQVEAKHEQVERIEDRLENLIESQASRLQRTQLGQPGMLALPGKRTQWQQQMQQQQKTMQHLLGRLELVREVRDSMGVHAPRIEELATRKLRTSSPNWPVNGTRFSRRSACTSCCCARRKNSRGLTAATCCNPHAAPGWA